jgi:two-component system phosphate regulon sensor histidine kinase PhoR
MGERNYHLRLVVWTWGLLLVVLALLFFVMAHNAERSLVRDSEERAWGKLELAAWLLPQKGPFADDRALEAWTVDLGQRLGCRVTFIVGGRVRADSDVSEVDLPRLEDHSMRPEVLQARLSGRGKDVRTSATLGKDLIYVAARMNGVEGLADGVLRLAVPFSEVRAALSRSRVWFTAVLIPAMLISALATWWGLRRMALVIRDFSDTVKAIGEGDLDRRVRDFPGREFAVLADSINNMAKRIKRDMKTIRDQTSRFQAVFDGMAEGVAVVAPDGRIESHNTALASMFSGLTNLAGRIPLEAGLPLESQQAVDQLLSDPAAPGPVVRQVQYEEHRFLEVVAVPFLDHKDRRGLILVFHDISEIKRVESILRDFVGNASHQLRTPLTSIKGYAEVLIDMPPEDPGKAREILGTILRNADHMSKVITCMFALAKSRFLAERGRSLPTDGRRCLVRAAETLAARLGEKNAALDFSGVPESGAVVLADDDALIQVFANILENAVKYGPEGGRVSVGFGQENGWGAFRFRDQGPGIPAADRERVFERFYRGDRNTIDLGGGAGLGLAICRDIVVGFGGTIKVEGPADPESGQGSVFVVRLKMA